MRHRSSNGYLLCLALWSVLGAAVLAPGPVLGQTERITAEVRTRQGELITLREIGFGSPVASRGAPPRGAVPPGVDPGPMPGGIADRIPSPEPRLGPGSLEPSQREVGASPGFDGGLGHYRGRVRRLVVVTVDTTGVLVNLTLVNGKTLDHRRMPWRQVYGWDRPGEQGKFYTFDAEEIDSIEFPTN